ncbi:TIGR03618 family F420-dependent PPOX class oxidoreductase [Actinomycetospora straminea]|uniref:PPOX class F420-dependent oxidoreductase n=1 Tax=Actinomycetospora straminea TaxID=663607 RepID=A0ABP9EQY7_9PSEU|nr:TIGR03618 family F420-dependent PPOX class oxidoreductase [Actinomycetospora straminea]MDD7933509.1 TIGR03618 family F420-dependent PPOX class oxidoreductase [Actinomycetospora straminea]
MTLAPQQEERLPQDVVALLRGRNPCFLATVLPDGTPETSETWVDTDGVHIVLNAVEGAQLLDNVRRDPRVSIAIADARRAGHVVTVRGRVVDVSPVGAVEHLESLARRYLGRPYPWHRPGQTHLIVRIAPTAVHRQG